MRAPRLTDGVVVLDSFRLGDAPAHLAGKDEEQARRFGWYPARSTEATVATAIRRWQRQWRSGGPTRALAARKADTGVPVGGSEIRLLGGGGAEMSYWVFPAYRRRGIGTRIARFAGDYAVEHLGVVRIELLVERDNIASCRVAENAGFVEEGVRSREPAPSGEPRELVVFARCAPPSR